MTEDEKKAINNMKLFARVHEDMTTVTASEMDIVLKLVERLQNKYELAIQALMEVCDVVEERNQLLNEIEHKSVKIENQKTELAILNDKQKEFNNLQNTLNSYKGQFKRQEKEKKEYLKVIQKLNQEKEEWMNAYQEEKDAQFKLLNENKLLQLELERQKEINTIINSNKSDKLYSNALEKVMTTCVKNNFDKDYIPIEKVTKLLKESEDLIDNSQGCILHYDLIKEYGKIEAYKSLLNSIHNEE